MTTHDDGCCPLCGQPRRDTAIMFDGITLDAGTITKGGITMNLPPVLYAITVALLRRPQGMTVNSLMQVIYGDRDDPPYEKNIDVHLCRLRKGLGHDAVISRGGLKVLLPDRIALNPDAEWSGSNMANGIARTRHAREWTEADDAELTRLFGLDLPDDAIGAALGRGWRSVRWRRQKLRLIYHRRRAA